MQVVIQSIGSFSETPASLEKNTITGIAKLYMMRVIAIRSFGSSGDRATVAQDELQCWRRSGCTRIGENLHHPEISVRDYKSRTAWVGIGL
jgi:hypothetical protein